MSERLLHFANSAVRVTWQEERAGRLVEFLFRDVPGTGPGVPHINLSIVEDVPSGSFLLSASDSPEQWQAPAGQAAVWLMERACYHLADRSSGGMLLHAACLVKNGRAILFPGVSGSGKSTLAVWLAGQGFQLMSDELVFLPTGTLHCQGFLRPVYLKAGAGQLFPDLEPQAVLPVESGEEPPPGSLLRIGEGDGCAAPDPVNVQAVVFPRYQAGAKQTMERLSKADAALALTEVLINARNLPQNGFPELLRVARSVPAFRTCYGGFLQLETFLQNISVTLFS